MWTLLRPSDIPCSLLTQLKFDFVQECVGAQVEASRTISNVVSKQPPNLKGKILELEKVFRRRLLRAEAPSSAALF